ncbi:MAG: hypothetical protein ABI728_13535 [Betaproteobacteria bacterium]
MRRYLRVFAVLIAALPWWPAHTAEPLGRLFFTPAQRNALDAGKHVRTSQISPASAVRVPQEVTLNGVVTRSDGESTVWVNGRPLDQRPDSGVNATASGSDPAAARVKVRGASNTVRMRVGQRLRPSTGKMPSPTSPLPNAQLPQHPPGEINRHQRVQASSAENPTVTSEFQSDD